jgi:hypothetical protein
MEVLVGLLVVLQSEIMKNKKNMVDGGTSGIIGGVKYYFHYMWVGHPFCQSEKYFFLSFIYFILLIIKNKNILILICLNNNNLKY